MVVGGPPKYQECWWGGGRGGPPEAVDDQLVTKLVTKAFSSTPFGETRSVGGDLTVRRPGKVATSRRNRG